VQRQRLFLLKYKRKNYIWFWKTLKASEINLKKSKIKEIKYIIMIKDDYHLLKFNSICGGSHKINSLITKSFKGTFALSADLKSPY
jgi:hypothetical protein